MKEAETNGKSFKEALNEGIWHKGKNGLQTKIRHVRIKTSAKEPLIIKKQTHISDKPLVNLETREHKKFYYAANGENYAFALYQGLIKNKIERGFKLYGLFDVAGMVATDGELIIPTTKEIKKGIEIPLLAILKHGQKVLFYQDTVENMERLNQKELSKRLYRIFAFEQESEGKGRISLQHHLDTSVANKSAGESSLNLESPHPILRISKDNFNFLIEGKDFTCEPDGTVIWK